MFLFISTKHGGFTQEEWDDKYGYLIDIDSMEQLRKALKKMYVNYNKFDLNYISKKCLSSCSEIIVIKEINEELTSALL